MRQARSLEPELLEARGAYRELRRHHEEELGSVVARKTKQAAEELRRHEARLDEVVSRYEARLAKAEFPQDLALDVATQSALQDAQAAACAASAKVDRYKVKADKAREKQEKLAKKVEEHRSLIRAQQGAADWARNSLTLRVMWAAWRSRLESRRQSASLLHLAARRLAKVSDFALCETCFSQWRHHCDEARRSKHQVKESSIRQKLIQSMEFKDQMEKQVLAVEVFWRWAMSSKLASARHESEVQLANQACQQQQDSAAKDRRIEEVRIATRERWRGCVEGLTSSRQATALLSVLSGWARCARSSAAAKALEREVGEVQSRSSWVLSDARDEIRGLRRGRASQALAAVTAKERLLQGLALKTWLLEVRALRAARQLSAALDDVQFRNQRAFASHRSQAEASRKLANKTGLKLVEAKAARSLHRVLVLWKSAVQLTRRTIQTHSKVLQCHLEKQGLDSLKAVWHIWHTATLQGRCGRQVADANHAQKQLEELEEEIGRARRAGSRAGQAASRKAWAASWSKQGDLQAKAVVLRYWADLVGTLRADAGHSAALQALRAELSIKVPTDVLVDAEKLRTRAAGEVAQQALILAWPTAPQQIGRSMHWLASAFEAWWWAIVLPRCQIEDLEVPSAMQTSHAVFSSASASPSLAAAAVSANSAGVIAKPTNGSSNVDGRRRRSGPGGGGASGGGGGGGGATFRRQH